MSLASDLQGLGVQGLLAAHTASAGTGPVTITAAGSSFATSTRIGVTQFLVTCVNGGDGGGAAIALPMVGSDAGCLIGDDFTVNNGTGAHTLQVWASSGVLISAAGSNNSNTLIPIHTTSTFYPISTTQWFAVKGT